MSFADILVLVLLDSSADLVLAGLVGLLDSIHGLCLCRLRLVRHRARGLGHVLGNLVVGIPEELGSGMWVVGKVGEVLDT